MKKWIKKSFSVTNMGASNIFKAIFASLLVNISSFLPLILIILYLNKIISNIYVYVILSIILLILLYISLSNEYDKLYNITYNESANLRIDIGKKLSKLPLAYFSKKNLSDLSQTIMSDIAKMEHAISHSLAQTISFIIFFVVTTIGIFFFNIKMGLALSFPFVINVILLFMSKKIQVKKHTKYYNILRENAQAFQETIELQQEIQSMGMQDEVNKGLYKKMDDTEVVHFDVEASITALLSAMNLLMFISLGVIILVGTNLYLNHEISIMSIVCLMIIALKLNEGAIPVTLNISELFYIDARVKRLKEIRNTKIQEGEDKKLKTFDVTLKNVSFRYEDKEKEVLENISFTAKQNEVTALVGKSGCGKSTLLKLIARLYDYDSGEILIDNYDIKKISTSSLFKHISVVFQDVMLFNSSILENVRIGNLSASDEEVKKALTLANCDEFIQKLPQGYNTIIGENGVNLSGGQRQRISIARAFLKNASIILLDEISSSLDVYNETKIQESLQRLIKDKTVIIVSHRIKSIENADKILVLDEGKVVGEGKHNELLKSCKTYKNLVDKINLTEKFKY